MSKEPLSLADLFAQQEDLSPITPKLSEPKDEQLAKSVANVIKKSPAPMALPEVHPKTVKESMSILQSKTMTYASYDLTAVQEDMLTFITEQLQDFASSKASLIRPDLFGQLSVELDTNDFPSLERNKKKMLAQVDDLRKKDFEFSWNCHFANTPEAKSMFAERGINPDYVEVETKGTIITTRHDIKHTSRVILNINPWSIPYLLYYGPKVGGTKYYKEIALGLPSKYSKRIYKMIMDWHTMGDYHEEPIADFRYCLQIPESYDNNKIKKEILDKAKKEILASGSHITFDYELVTRNYSSSKTKHAADTIAFSIKGNHVKRDTQEMNYKIMQMLLVEIADKNRGSLCESCAKKIVEDGKYDHILSKFKYYDVMLQNRQMTKSAYKSTLLKIVLEETGFELRSPEHIKNSERYKKKNGLSGSGRK